MVYSISIQYFTDSKDIETCQYDILTGMTLDFLDIFKIVVVFVSATDFIIYAMLFLSYMIYVPFKK
jgi:hypothetical protein